MSMYQKLTQQRGDSNDLRKCMEETIELLKEHKTDVDHPGMLLGNIQSGKTRAFTGIIALGFDTGYDITVVLTKGTKALVKQTVLRLKGELKEFEEKDELRIYDIMAMPEDLNEYVIEKQKLIIVVKKEDDNINRLTKFFFEVYPSLSSKKVLIVDDEADFVSIGYSRKKIETGERETDINVISKQISDFRNTLVNGSDYLQVTATPYSLYLQPEDIKIRGVQFAPMRPRFTVLLPIHDRYIGSDYYFEQSKKKDSPAQFLFQSVDENELTVLSKTHGKIKDNALTSPSIRNFRNAILNYITASVIRIVQSEREEITNYKSSFIIHTETGRAKHENQAALASELIEALKVQAKMNSSVIQEMVRNSYNDLLLSVSLTDYVKPSLREVYDKFREYVRYITIRKVNSDSDVLSLLNFDTGELRLESPLNIFIGGQILDRGITVQNLIGFFYGRNPKRMQQDTVMQHARIFGARTLEDMAVTRLYTTARIYEAMRRMHEADLALREAFMRNGEKQKVAFIQKASSGKIIPCNPNKLLLSNTVTLRPGGTLPIYGFAVAPKYKTKNVVKQITNLISDLGKGDYTKPFLIPVSVAKEIVDLIYQTFEPGVEVLGATKDEFRAAIEYTSSQSTNKVLKGYVYCFANSKPKRSARFKENQRGKMFNDVNYDGRTDGKIGKEVAVDIPSLFLSFQAGEKEKGWSDCEFYWPVLFVQQNLVTSIFTSNVQPDESDEDDLTDDTGPMRK